MYSLTNYLKNIIYILLILTLKINAQVEDLIKDALMDIEKGYAFFDEKSMIEGRAKLERISLIEPDNVFAKYHLAYADYRLITLYMQNRNLENFNKFSSESVEILKQLSKSEILQNEAKSLLGAIYGLMLTVDQSSVMTLGPASQTLLAEAYGSEPNNPRVLLLLGVSKFNSPEFFGGSKEKALELFIQAVEEFENIPATEDMKPNWGYLDALAWLGISQSALGNKEGAIKSFKKALEINPEFGWIKYKLLPGTKSSE